MKMFPILCCSGCLLLTSAMMALPQQTRTDINPALQYYQSFILVPDLQQADKDYLFTNEWRGQKLPDRFGSLLARYNNQFRLLRQAAQQKGYCDWGIDMSFGPATLLPQLSRNKAASQTARLRVLWDLQHAQETEARDDLLATFTLARNSSRDGTLISALVQIAMENIICLTVAENFHRLSPETLEQLVAGFDAAPPRGTVANCIATEKAFFRDWMVNKIHDLQQATPGNETKIMAAIHELIASTEGPEEGDAKPAQASLADRVANASGGTSEGVLKLLQDEEPFYQRITQILALPQVEYEAQMKLFMVDVQNSSNPFIQPFFNAYDKCAARENGAIIRLAQVRAAVEYKLRGPEGFKSVNDPLGNGPFSFRRFILEGVDRGFELKSAYEGKGAPQVLIFVEKEGPAFRSDGPNAGKSVNAH